MGSCQTTYEQYNQAFLAATPDIAQEIKDYSFRMPMWLADNWELKKWEATDNVMQQLIFRGSLPEVERGFNKWKQLASSAGCEPCVNDCSYNFTTLGGHGFQRQLIGLMGREFKTDTYCVNSIKTALEYEQTFGKIIENIQYQVSIFKEYNIGFNFLTGIALKGLVDGTNIRFNTQNPFDYRGLGNAILSKMNTRITTKIYEGLRRRQAVTPFDIVNGKPVYAVSASDELLDALYLEDPSARQDLRFSSAADALLTRYNFMSTIRGQFINAPILYPRRFLDPVQNGGQWIEVAPWINGIPAEQGQFSDLNPEWEAAPFEEALFYGRSPFSLFYRDQITTIGEGTSFGPEPSFMNYWLWVNIQTDCDIFRRQGYFATAIEMALSAQYSDGVYGIIFPRPSTTLLASYWPTGVCPPSAQECTNTVPPIVECPCGLVLSAVPSAFTSGLYTVTFAAPQQLVAEQSISLGIKTGGYLTGTVVRVTTDKQTAEIQFAAGTVITNCDGFTFVFCNNDLGCSATVLNACDCRAGETDSFTAILSNPIKATANGQVVYGYMGDGTVQHFVLVGAADMLTNTWTLAYAPGYGPTDDPSGEGDTPLEADIICNRNGLVKLCVPPTTDATCPACGGPTLTACAS